ncbi:lipoprotein-releasing system ATP-binding protein LolD [Candidatus Poribacteria bacterium]|jgi:lipoprotein-releasing system ATP-binding protein|nr:lipoprotein-releasing system ATP-binding protein LolD [Candidatus Poribacteria bacterium]MBT21943.1 lipoprotein-releasing system ATP-binding protein LolD [Candidatus Poribacteria bacterium]MCS5612719.1 ABC transporter ATP-binding protein [Candidatus Poribacteria bacterium]MEC7866552.1 ABC transporter ATP-binding protein [Candidatus Poribacteria bacterium]MEC9259314.1 ABC transporter ATP-binding protein [Candidatus Poribacteria bacterium]
MSNLIRVKDLYKTYVDATSDDITTQVEVLKGVDVEVRQGEVLAILGKSGVGKSTLLHLIGGLDRPTSGSVFFEDRNIHAYNDRQLDRFRNLEIGFIFQFHHLLPEFTALENIAIGGLIAKKNVSETYGSAGEILDYVDLADRSNHYPSELSGGERQRIAIGRALINQPKVILADEPTGNLDRKTSDDILDLLWDLNGRLNRTLILVTHDHGLAQRADRMVHIVDGKIANQNQIVEA